MGCSALHSRRYFLTPPNKTNRGCDATRRDAMPCDAIMAGHNVRLYVLKHIHLFIHDTNGNYFSKSECARWVCMRGAERKGGYTKATSSSGEREKATPTNPLPTLQHHHQQNYCTLSKYIREHVHGIAHGLCLCHHHRWEYRLHGQISAVCLRVSRMCRNRPTSPDDEKDKWEKYRTHIMCVYLVCLSRLGFTCESLFSESGRYGIPLVQCICPCSY
ncbi:hypothetical protein F5Y03DRAFT_373719 [Xylaria venustula]|nr:hypothetical protein F5Y03DRAFT_373719 [Xylaria venustula]